MQVCPEPGMGAVVVTQDGCLFDGAVHAFYLAVGPRMLGLCQTMFNIVLGTADIEHVPGRTSLSTLTVTGRVTKGTTVVGEHGVDLVGHIGNQVLQKSGSGFSGRVTVQLGIGKLAGPVDGHEQVELAFFGTDLSNIDVKEPDRVSLKSLLILLCYWLGQPADAVALVAAMQAGSGQMGNFFLQGIKTVVQGQ